jgi:hypothetical protein
LAADFTKFLFLKVFLKSQPTLSAKDALSRSDRAWTNYPGSFGGGLIAGTFSIRPPTFALSSSAGAQNYFGVATVDKWRDGMTVVIVRSEFKESIAGVVVA